MTPYEQMRAFEARQANGASIDAIMAEFHLGGPAVVRNRLKLLALSPKAMERFADGSLNSTAAYGLAMVPEAHQDRMLSDVLTGRYANVEAIKEAARAMRDGTVEFPAPIKTTKQRKQIERISALMPVAQEPNAAKLAAEARKAVAQARAVIQASKVESEAPVVRPAKEMVTIWLDDDKLGCGYRNLIVLEKDDRTVTLCSPSLLRTTSIPRREFDRYARPYVAKASSITKIIARNVETFDNLKIEYEVRAARNAREAMMA